MILKQLIPKKHLFNSGKLNCAIELNRLGLLNIVEELNSGGTCWNYRTAYLPKTVDPLQIASESGDVLGL